MSSRSEAVAPCVEDVKPLLTHLFPNISKSKQTKWSKNGKGM
jgi:hypothetical protein